MRLGSSPKISPTRRSCAFASSKGFSRRWDSAAAVDIAVCLPGSTGRRRVYGGLAHAKLDRVGLPSRAVSRVRDEPDRVRAAREPLARRASSSQPEGVAAGQELAAPSEQPDARSGAPELDLQELDRAHLGIGLRADRPGDEGERRGSRIGHARPGRRQRDPRDEVDLRRHRDSPGNMHFRRVADTKHQLTSRGTGLGRQVRGVGANDDGRRAPRPDAHLLWVDGDLDTLRRDRDAADRDPERTGGDVRDL